LDATVYTDSSVIQEAGLVVPIKVNAEKEGVALAKKYNVHGYPTILFLDEKGDVSYKIGGFIPAPAFKTEIGIANDAYLNLAKYEKQLQSNPANVGLEERVALIYIKKDNVSHGAQLLKQAEMVDPEGKKGPLDTAYDALGNYYQDKDIAKSNAAFESALKITHDDFIRADATLSLAQNYFGTDKAKAQQYLMDLQAQPNAPAEWKKIGESMLKQLQKTKTG